MPVIIGTGKDAEFAIVNRIYCPMCGAERDHILNGECRLCGHLMSVELTREHGETTQTTTVSIL